jgi:hypothetical protein
MTQRTKGWRAQAICAQPDMADSLELFFPLPGDKAAAAAAKQICAGCPVRAACLDNVLAIEDGRGVENRHGISGGLSPKQRYERSLRAHKRAAPAEPKPLPKKREPAKCGTRAGYKKHQREKSAICGPCRQANTDADNRLRRTGTSRVAA